MDAYTNFAEVYDIFMDETPYEEWCEFIVSLLQQYGEDKCMPSDVIQDTAADSTLDNAQDIATNGTQDNAQDNAASGALKQERNTILDLGCGTGALTELLAAKGYDMIGIDNSQEMLQIAMEKRQHSGYDILYLLQDMREFELYGTVGAVISVCDSMNYLLDENELLTTFRLVDNYLYPRGIFIFDFNTVYKYEVVIGDATIAENRENCSFIWENYYHREEEINEYDLTFFVKNDNGDNNSFKRFSETHYQRGYTLRQMKLLVEKAGMEFVDALDADTHKEVTAESERIYIIAREQHKKIS